MVDPGDPLPAIWDKEWHDTLLEAGLAAVKTQVSAKQWQIFELCTLQEWPVRDVAKGLGVSVGQVYLARHRISALLKKQIRKLERGTRVSSPEERIG